MFSGNYIRDNCGLFNLSVAEGSQVGAHDKLAERIRFVVDPNIVREEDGQIHYSQHEAIPFSTSQCSQCN